MARLPKGIELMLEELSAPGRWRPMEPRGSRQYSEVSGERPAMFLFWLIMVTISVTCLAVAARAIAWARSAF